MRGTITYSNCAGNTESGFKHVTYSRVFPKYIIIMLSGDKRLYSSYIVVCLAELHTDTISTNLLTKYRANTHDVQKYTCMYVYIYILAHMCIGEKITSPYTASHTHTYAYKMYSIGILHVILCQMYTYVCVFIVVVSGENEFKIWCIPYHRWGNRTL